MEHENIGSCGSGDCGGTCMLCCLFVCKHCGLFEGAMTTDCPGVCAMDKADEIYKTGKLDFREGKWVTEPNPHNQMRLKYPSNCPTCEAPARNLHPFSIELGEWQMCKDDWHNTGMRTEVSQTSA